MHASMIRVCSVHLHLHTTSKYVQQAKQQIHLPRLNSKYDGLLSIEGAEPQLQLANRIYTLQKR